MGGLAFVPPATFLYIGTEIWYGNVIPSCYLVNSSDIKDYIMDNGWMDGFSKIYKSRKPKDEAKNPPKRNVEVAGSLKSLQEKATMAPQELSTVPNGTRPKQTIPKGNANAGYKNKTMQKYGAHTQKQIASREDVILYDLDGIQTSQRIPGDAPKSRKCSKINENSNSKFRRPKDKSKVAPIFSISNNSHV